MKRRFRLRRRQDFERVMRAQRVFAGRAIVAFATPSASGSWRVGVTVSRRLRGAVVRNRLRRRLREAARASLLGAGAPGSPVDAGYDVVLIGRPAAVDLPLQALSDEAARVRSRLAEADA
ncbi:MAG TPA: ribonuclease P protein component [Terriglobales bacterium]|nr:ribonuclease P protein component [Terriglobales bacterium]